MLLCLLECRDRFMLYFYKRPSVTGKVFICIYILFTLSIIVYGDVSYYVLELFSSVLNITHSTVTLKSS